MKKFDVVIVGAGIAGSSVAAHLAGHCRVAILEMESQPGYHSTGRSAAYFAPAYGNKVVRDITAASEEFFRHPTANFTDVPLLVPRDTLFLARSDQTDSLAKLLVENPDLVQMNTSEIKNLVPMIKEAQTESGAYDATGGDLDVHAILQGFLRQFQSRGGEVVTNTEVNKLRRISGLWKLDTTAGEFEAPVVVNAAGAWADKVATLAGLTALGITPYRRTALLVDPPPDQETAEWPMVADVDDQFYLKPDAGQLLISPADETPSPPCDAAPEEIDIATAINRVQRVTHLNVRKVNHSWAGLRSFAPDKTFVTGFDPRTEGFFWLAGQGGYGVQTSPALSDIAAYLITGNVSLISLEEAKAHVDKISPERLL